MKYASSMCVQLITLNEEFVRPK